MPDGRGGTGGTAPAAMRSLQSATISRPRLRPNWVMKLLISDPRWPRRVRSSQAARLESNSSRSGTTRVRSLPTWWQRWQPFRTLIHSLWLCSRSLMPFPSSPVPGNSWASGRSMRASQ